MTDACDRNVGHQHTSLQRLGGLAMPLRTAGVVLAGGAGRRMGGGKPLQHLGERTLIEHVINRFRPQVEALWISARDNRGTLVGYGLPVIEDRWTDKPGGALAAVVSALHAATLQDFDCVATVPCDTPFLPRDLARRLHERLLPTRAPGIIVESEDGLQPTIGLWRTAALDALLHSFDAGDRALGSVFRAQGALILDVARCQWTKWSFFNVNTRADLARATNHLRSDSEA